MFDFCANVRPLFHLTLCLCQFVYNNNDSTRNYYEWIQIRDTHSNSLAGKVSVDDVSKKTKEFVMRKMRKTRLYIVFVLTERCSNREVLNELQPDLSLANEIHRTRKKMFTFRTCIEESSNQKTRVFSSPRGSHLVSMGQ